jgi:Trypsin-like peptidase domain/PEP-CTERM motif
VKHSLFLAAVGFGLVLAPAAGLAVINADNPTSSTPDNQTAPNGVAGWYNVGQVINPGNSGFDASGVYIRNGWVLTCDHVGADNFDLNGTVYQWNGKPEIRLTNPDGQSADLVLYQLTSLPSQPNLSNAVLSSTSTTSGTIYNVGYGLARNTAEETFSYNGSSYVQDPSGIYGGFGYGSTFAKSWGSNLVQGTTSYNIGFGEVNAFYGDFFGFTDQLINGDSGGGVFNTAGQLVGINNAIGGNMASNAVLFDDESFMIDISPFYSQIMTDTATSIPEPGSLALVTLGGVALLRRRRGPRC